MCDRRGDTQDRKTLNALQLQHNIYTQFANLIRLLKICPTKYNLVRGGENEALYNYFGSRVLNYLHDPGLPLQNTVHSHSVLLADG